ncbi:MAG TPA: hypothetical protein VGV90_06640, partial [Solirubrobacteraceae bacterium]|nr:hypothetical protein [Solirubrobacteraceae bacterium]
RVPPGRRAIALAAGAVLLVAVALGLALLSGGNDGADPGQAGQTVPGTAVRPTVADAPKTGILTRPNALTIAAGQVWAMSFQDGAIALLDAETGEGGGPRGRINVGPGGSSLASGFNSVWVAKQSTPTVLRINARTRRRVAGGAVQIARPGRNMAVATGAGAVWVAVRNPSDADRSPESVVRIDPRTGAQESIEVEGGVQDLAVGEGAVWVTNRFAATVTRIGVRDRRLTRIRVGADPKGVAVGENAVWVASAADDEITRINPRSLETRHIPIQAIPERVTVGGGSVWATAREAGRLIRIDAKTRKVLERIDTGPRPYALDITRGRAVWLTLLDDNGLQRVRFARRRG